MRERRNADFFDGFAWAVHKAFSEPLASCRFEQGDTLYDTSEAYEGRWDDALHRIRFSVQVQSPSRGSTSKTQKDDDSMFASNWRQPLTLKLTEYPLRETRMIATTQGRLYSTLWKGDLRQLEDGIPEPSIPKLPKEALKELPATMDFFVDQHGEGLQHPVLFIMPFDETRDILRAKHDKVRNSLAQEFHPHIVLVPPKEAGLPKAEDYIPTLKIACFLMDTPNQEAVYTRLKAALYTPSKEKTTAVERFRLKVHGYLHPHHSE